MIQPSADMTSRAEMIPLIEAGCCPACGAKPAARAEHGTFTFIDDPSNVCSKCGESGRSASAAIISPPSEAGAAAMTLEAVREPAVTYSHKAAPVWAAKAAADVDRRVPEPSRLPGAVAFVAAVLFLAGFVGWRGAAVEAVPDLAGLYAAIGLPVRSGDLALEDVSATRVGKGQGGARLTLRGSLRNAGDVSRRAAPMAVAFLDARGAELGGRAFNPPPRDIPAGAAEPFALPLGDAPPGTVEVAVRLRPAALPTLAPTGLRP